MEFCQKIFGDKWQFKEEGIKELEDKIDNNDQGWIIDVIGILVHTSDDKIAYLFDVESGEVEYTFDIHSDYVFSIAFSLDSFKSFSFSKRSSN